MEEDAPEKVCDLALVFSYYSSHATAIASPGFGEILRPRLRQRMRSDMLTFRGSKLRFYLGPFLDPEHRISDIQFCLLEDLLPNRLIAAITQMGCVKGW